MQILFYNYRISIGKIKEQCYIPENKSLHTMIEQVENKFNNTYF